MPRKMTGGGMFDNMGYFLIFLLAVAVFLFIVAIIFLVVQKRSKDKAGKIPASQRSPPYEYMKNVGINCPDYWQYMGEDPNQEGHHLCKNVNNIKVHDDEQCYTDKDNKMYSFPNVDWERNVDDKGYISGKAVDKMCSFKKKCGPSQNQDASWLGVDSSHGWVKC